MQFKLPDLTDNKMVFPDWTWVLSGYGYGRNYAPGKQPQMDKVPQGLEIHVFPPTIDPQPLFVHDKPWEDRLGPYCSVLRFGKCWRLYYEEFPITPQGGVSDRDSRLCIAESEDGAHWHKPNLEIIPWEGITDTNLIFIPELLSEKSGLHGVSIFEDPTAPPEMRYKMTHRRKENIVYGATSSDGLHWKLTEEPIITAMADSQDVVEWDPDLQKYLGFFRYTALNKRMIARGETSDFFHWPDPIPLLQSHPEFTPDMDFYTNGYHRWPGTSGAGTAHILFPSIYHRSGDYVDSEFWVSRNTFQWDRPSHNPMIVPKTIHQTPQGMSYLGHGFWSASDLPFEWALGCVLFEKNHNTPHRPGECRGKLHRAHWREDGFAGLVAKAQGEFWTPAFTARLKNIKINAITLEGGQISIEVWDAMRNAAIEDLEMKLCEPLTGDLRWADVKWNSESSLNDYEDAQLQLHVQMARTTLFGIKFDS